MESTVQDWRLIEINHVCFYYALQYWFISSLFVYVYSWSAGPHQVETEPGYHDL